MDAVQDARLERIERKLDALIELVSETDPKLEEFPEPVSDD